MEESDQKIDTNKDKNGENKEIMGDKKNFNEL